MKMDRRAFIKGLSCATAGLLIGGCNEPSKGTEVAVNGAAPRKLKSNKLKSGVFVVEGTKPSIMVKSVLEEMGGIGALISKGDKVIVKPNIGWDRTPEEGANTNPELIKTIVELCYKAGAKLVKVFDRTCNDAKRCYKNSGIGKAAEMAGAKVEYVSESSSFYSVVTSKDCNILKSWPVYQDVLDADVIINVPILKHHSIAGITIGMKNLMGLLGSDRGEIHQKIDKKLPDLTRLVPVELVIVDAYRILTKNGPSGGDLSDVRMGNQFIVSTNVTMADAWATKVFGLDPTKTDFLKAALTQGLGEINPAKIKVKKIKA